MQLGRASSPFKLTPAEAAPVLGISLHNKRLLQLATAKLQSCDDLPGSPAKPGVYECLRPDVVMV